jgi:MerR family mercuric resistance operon transcriptional regulator
MRTKEIVEKTGIDKETLRFYESKGLLPEAKRTESGYRIFSTDTVQRIQFITTAKQSGFTLGEIKGLLDLQQNRGPCRSSRDMAKSKKTEISDKIKALKKMDKLLTRFIYECEKNGVKGLSKPCHFSFEKCC